MKWLLTDTVLAIHKLQIAEHGGDDGVRDLGLIDSALARPMNISAYDPDADLARLAAAYAYGIAKNQPFVDGNKRTSLVASRTFLALNDFTLKATQPEKYNTYLALANGSLTEEALAAWIREHLSVVK